MELEILGQDYRISDNLDAYARKKLEKLDRYLPNIVNVRVELRRDHTRRGEDLSIAQITVRHKRGAILRAQESYAGDMEGALNLAVDNMYRQIQRFKGKRDHKRHERFTATQDELRAAEAIPELEAISLAGIDYVDSQVVRRKDVVITAMSEEEAIEQMELLGHNFFLFFNPLNGGINLLYKRRAGDYGVLNPILE